MTTKKQNKILLGGWGWGGGGGGETERDLSDRQ